RRPLLGIDWRRQIHVRRAGRLPEDFTLRTRMTLAAALLLAVGALLSWVAASWPAITVQARDKTPAAGKPGMATPIAPAITTPDSVATRRRPGEIEEVK